MRRAKFAAEPLELNAQLYPYSCRPLEMAILHRIAKSGLTTKGA